jgi:leucyl-tRNA synthetase
MKAYNHKEIENKWQKEWAKTKIYSPNLQKDADPFYNLWMFPYPSAEGLHAGHAFASTGSDVIGRFMRMNGRSVFQPIGYDSFGIHAENYAIKINETPQKMLSRAKKHYEEQFKSLGHGYDWDHTVTTSDVDYYHWTEWVFLQLFKAGLAYRKKAEVNFCPKDKTVLSDEQVMTPKQAGKDPIDAAGKPVPLSEGLMVCERCGTIVEKRNLEVWFFRITDYAERLLQNLSQIDWSQRVKIAQKEWIGKKEGVFINHKVKNSKLILKTFSAYPAWLFADTFLVIAPEHPLVSVLVKGTKYEKDVSEFVAKIKAMPKEERGKEKLGVFTGQYVIDPFSGKEMPVWLANFALMDFGTGIIRCSAHDVRDFEFASKYKIPLNEVVERLTKNEPINAHNNEGKLKNSGPFSGREINEKLIEEILDWIENKKIGERTNSYHLRDWGIGRQRYWGCPLPMIFCQNCAEKGLGYFSEKKDLIHKDQSDWNWQGWWPEENLPVELPIIEDYKPEGNGRGPLANHPEFYNVKCPHCGNTARRETDVADTFLDSSWYFLRYPSTDFNKVPFDPKITKKWLPVNLYFGGAEHAVLHLMYARFVTMVLHDLKHLNFEEPFPKFYAHGLMIKDGAKMSKSRGNVVNPDEYVNKFGADTLRMYSMFLGQMDGYPDFRDTGIEGMQKFTNRIWSLYFDNKENKDKTELNSHIHKTIQKVTKDIQIFHYNTAIASIMELVNYLKENGTAKEALGILCQLIAPFAPHLSEEIWVEVLGNKYSVHTSKWPQFDSKAIKIDQTIIIVQVDGKMRGQLVLKKEIHEDEIKDIALEDEKVQKWINGGKFKVIYVPGKIINFVLTH